jgi:hypothetical protein
VTVYEPIGRLAAVELVNVTVDSPGAVQAPVAEVPVIATGEADTVLVTLLLLEKLELQA